MKILLCGDIGFLCRVRSHPDCELHIITPRNRDELYAQLKKEYNI